MLGQGLGAEIGAAVALELQGNVYIPIHDHRGNVALLLDEQGNPTETYRYTAFGKEQSNESINPWRFSSKRMEGPLIYFGKRFYDPALGRWLSPDPQGFEDGPNLYAYVLNNPMTHFDLYGLFITGAQYSLFNNYKSSSPSTGGYGVHNIGRAVFNTSANIFNSPRFQGSMQAFGGLVETGVGIGVSLGSYGFAAPVGLPIMAHGLDHFFTGIRTAVSGTVQETATAQLLQKTGMSPRAAGLVDNGMSMVGTLGGAAVIQGSRAAASLALRFPETAASNFGGMQTGGKIFQPFTKQNFRANLMELTGISPGKSAQAHHVFPQKFREDFMSKSINIHDPTFGTWWETTNHQVNARQYNVNWSEFFRKYPEATQAQILEEGKVVMMEYGIKTNY